MYVGNRSQNTYNYIGSPNGCIIEYIIKCGKCTLTPYYDQTKKQIDFSTSPTIDSMTGRLLQKIVFINYSMFCKLETNWNKCKQDWCKSRVHWHYINYSNINYKSALLRNHHIVFNSVFQFVRRMSIRSKKLIVDIDFITKIMQCAKRLPTFIFIRISR